MRRRPPRSTRTDTLFPYTTLFRSQVMAGGNDSSANAIANAMLRLVEHPELQERLRAQPELVPQFVEETLRLDAPVQKLFREPKHDMDIAGVRVPKGSVVVLQWGAAKDRKSTRLNSSH